MLIHPDKSFLLAVDIQEKLLPAIHEKQRLVDDCRWLIEIANILKVPVLASEQYPAGLGRTIVELRELLPDGQYMEKTHFSCLAEPSCRETIDNLGRDQAVIIGTEAHVCVLQTVLELKQRDKEVYVVAECVSSRKLDDKNRALERMRACGVHIVSREMVAFEWMQRAGTETFRQISREFLR